MTPVMTNKDFAGLGAPDLVYVRAIRASDVMVDAHIEAPGVDIDPEQILYAVHGADGERLAFMVAPWRRRSGSLAAAL